jgi:hypothetical protein
VKRILALWIAFVAAGTACAPGTNIPGASITDADLESFFRNHPVDGNHVAALKKRSAGVISYLATVHGYPNNLSVCEELIKPYNENTSQSVLPGDYYCEELR